MSSIYTPTCLDGRRHLFQVLLRRVAAVSLVAQDLGAGYSKREHVGPRCGNRQSGFGACVGLGLYGQRFAGLGSTVGRLKVLGLRVLCSGARDKPRYGWCFENFVVS